LKYRDSFDPDRPQRYREHVPSAQVQVLDAGHPAPDAATDEIALLIREFVGCTRGKREKLLLPT
jgi:hypothetical protein